MKGTKVAIRALEPADVDLLYKWENDHSLWHLSNNLVPFSRFTLEQYVLNAGQDIYATRQLRMMIDLNKPEDGNKTVGSIDLFEFEPSHHRAGVGILLLESFRGKGFASEALDLLIDYAFNILNLHQLFTNIASNNPDSIRLFEKKGFKLIGTKKDWNLVRDKWYDESMFQLIREPEKE
jgi:diamine N-acetyltransferase